MQSMTVFDSHIWLTTGYIDSKFTTNLVYNIAIEILLFVSSVTE